VDGIIPEGFKASAEVVYDETSASGFLDQGLITNIEDSMALLYRSNPQSDWSLVPDFQINVQINPNNRRGIISWPELKKGEYVLAIYDAARQDTNYSVNQCLSTGISQPEEGVGFSIFPNPGTGRVTVKLESVFSAVEFQVYSITGDLVLSSTWPEGETQHTLELAEQAAGTYILKLLDNQGRQHSRTFIINQ
jgi:hypothetical protein